MLTNNKALFWLITQNKLIATQYKTQWHPAAQITFKRCSNTNPYFPLCVKVSLVGWWTDCRQHSTVGVQVFLEVLLLVVWYEVVVVWR